VGTDSGVSWGLPFEREEYEDRLARVREEMGRRGLDLLYVTSPPNLQYLKGFELTWYAIRYPTGLAIPREAKDGRPLFFGQWSDQPFPPSIPDEEKFLFQRGAFPHAQETVARELKSRGWLKGKVGVELWSRAQPYANMKELVRCLSSERGVELVDGSWTVDRVRHIQSPKEVEYVRTAAKIADAAYEAFRGALRPGVMEKELMGVMYQAMANRGGDEPALRIMVHSGSRGDQLHVPSRHRVLEQGDMVMVDMCAVYNGYHFNTARALSIGPGKPIWTDALEKLAEGVKATTACIEPGMPTAKLQELMDKWVDDAGLRPWVWWVGGYTLGLAGPGDWVGHVYLNPNEAFEGMDFDPGMVVNWEVQLWDMDQHEGCGIIDTMIMTEKGIDLPATFPRTLTVV
jgi:Xaa-Pro aminopeptidase